MRPTQESDRESLSEDDTLLQANDDSLVKYGNSSMRCWIITLTVVNIALFLSSIVIVSVANFERSCPSLNILPSKPRLNAALKELSSYCQSLNNKQTLSSHNN